MYEEANQRLEHENERVVAEPVNLSAIVFAFTFGLVIYFLWIFRFVAHHNQTVV